jgi:hypothetical protein
MQHRPSLSLISWSKESGRRIQISKEVAKSTGASSRFAKTNKQYLCVVIKRISIDGVAVTLGLPMA